MAQIDLIFMLYDYIMNIRYTSFKSCLLLKLTSKDALFGAFLNLLHSGFMIFFEACLGMFIWIKK